MCSREQRQALTPLHDAYREQFRAFREGEIDQFIEESQNTGAMMPGSEGWEQMKRQRDRIFSRIAAMDDLLFAAIEPILTDEQRALLPRVRMARKRARMLPTASMFVMHNTAADLSELVLEADLTLSERERIDPLLLNYEQRLTRLVEELPDVINAAWKQFHDVMEEMRQQMRDDPENAAASQETMMDLMREVYRKPQAHVVEMRALGRKTLYQSMPQISEASGRALRDAYVGRSYGMTSHRLRSSSEAVLSQLERRDDLDESQRRLVADVAAQTRGRIDAVTREALELADEHEREHTQFDGDSEASKRFNDQLKDFHERIREIDKAAMAQLASLVPQPGQQHGDRAAQGEDARRVAVQVAGGDGSNPVVVSGGRAAISRNTVAPPMSRSEAAEYAAMLRLEDDLRDAVDELHKSYTERVEETVIPLSSEARFFPRSEEADPVGAAKRATDAGRRAFEALVKEDERFLREMAALLPEESDQVERVHMARERTRSVGATTSGVMMWGSLGRTSSASIDLSKLARQQRIDIAAMPEVDRTLWEYERALTPLIREYHSKAVESGQMELLSMARMLAAQEDGAKERTEEMQHEWEEQRRVQTEARKLAHTIRELHTGTLEALRSELPADDADALLVKFRQLAYPSVYNDRGAMEQTFISALRMEDLSDAQRERLAELVADYRSDYNALTEQLREATEESEQARAAMFLARDGGERPNFDRRVFERVQTLQHERQEMNARGLIDLKGLLSEQQLARLGKLPDPGQSGSMYIRY